MNDGECLSKDVKVGGCGRTISDYDQSMINMQREEVRIGKREEKLEMDVNDLVEYVKWITGDLTALRDRVRIAEKVINDLRKSGQESVESLLNSLYDCSKRINGIA